jgi:hypothetical protein
MNCIYLACACAVVVKDLAVFLFPGDSLPQYCIQLNTGVINQPVSQTFRQ